MCSRNHEGSRAHNTDLFVFLLDPCPQFPLTPAPRTIPSANYASKSSSFSLANTDSSVSEGQCYSSDVLVSILSLPDSFLIFHRLKERPTIYTAFPIFVKELGLGGGFGGL